MRLQDGWTAAAVSKPQNLGAPRSRRALELRLAAVENPIHRAGEVIRDVEGTIGADGYVDGATEHLLVHLEAGGEILFADRPIGHEQEGNDFVATLAGPVPGAVLGDERRAAV